MMNLRVFKNFIFITFGFFALAPAALANTFSYQAEAYLKPTQTKKIDFEIFFNLYQAKCVHTTNPPHPCFLTEKEVDPRNGRANHILLFRGEPKLNPLPLTSSFYRWALDNKDVACKGTCSSSSLMTYLFEAARKLSPVGDNESLFYRHQDKSWRNDSGKVVPGTLSRNDTGLEVLARTHKIGSGLYFEESKNKLFDSMVSFSFDPLVADLFAKQKENKQGALWIASVPASAVLFMKGSECKNLIPEIGKVYDFNGCIDTALNDLEIEVNAVIYLPGHYYYHRLLQR